MPTPKNGCIGIQVAAALPHRVRVDVPPYAVEYRRDVFAGQELTIQLRNGATVTGVVRDKAGNALAAETVTLLLDPKAARYVRTDSGPAATAADCRRGISPPTRMTG